MHSSKETYRAGCLATALCCLSLVTGPASSDDTMLSAPDGKKQTSRFDLGGRKHFDAVFHLDSVAQDTSDWAPMAGVGLEDRQSHFTVLLHFSQPDGPETAWQVGVKYLEDGVVLRREELGSLSAYTWVRWHMNWDESGVVRYEVLGTPRGNLSRTSGTISTRITDPQGIRVASGLKGSFEIN